MVDKKEDLFEKIGLDIGNDKINIDLNKTKDFFSSLQNMLQEKADSIQKDFSEGKINLDESVGIKVDNEHINIDLGKIKSFMEDLGGKIESFIAEVDSAVKNIDKK